MNTEHANLVMCPENLLPWAVISEDHPMLALPEDESVAALRVGMTPEQLQAQINRIFSLAEQRLEFGIWGLLGLKTLDGGYPCIDSAAGSDVRRWMHGHEQTMVQRLQLALPSQGELIDAARQRIQARISARKQRRAMNDSPAPAGC
ncbi:hypothetical protein [Pseudomonas sp. GOM6]|uniref:hypothetical protein n=1 Tax=Pseudomonas sp. GOM6 TaxID=3036944 RepID=UPI002408F318|nr:hypothetical protein [Pseudomonas sp. GOM6]MDG1580958.1 hypothetical protein [Pseudomonas sp. GOM6]